MVSYPTTMWRIDAGAFWKWLRSIRLAIGLFIVIAVASLLGALLVQRASNDVYLSRYGSFWGHLILILRLDDVFHSNWYAVLLLLLFVDIGVCTVSRLRGVVRTALGVSFKDEAGLWNLKPLRESELHSSLEQARDILIQRLGRRFYRTRVKDCTSEEGRGSRYRIFAAKGGLSCFGPTVVHFSFLLVLAGGAWTGIRGYRYSRVLREGETYSVPGANFEVYLDSFSIERSEEGEVRQYKSRVVVLEEGEEVLEKTVMVNHPLFHKGIYIYQSGYGTELRELVKAKLTLTERAGAFPTLTFEVPFGERTPLPGTDFSVEVVDFVPDFVMDNRGIVASRTEEHRNPACRVRLFRGDTLEMGGWRFLNFPQFHSSEEERYDLQLVEYEPKYYTVLQMAKTPGLTLIYGSFILASIGLSLSFYMSHRRIWGSILPWGEGKVKVVIGGDCRRNRSAFERELDLIVNGLNG